MNNKDVGNKKHQPEDDFIKDDELERMAAQEQQLLPAHASGTRGSANGTRIVVVALILGFILGFGSAWLWLNPGMSADGVADEGSDELAEDGDSIIPPQAVIPPADLTIDEEFVNIKDQAAGSSVFVSQVAFKRGGWVAIADDDGGVPGRILGAKRFDPGTHQGTVLLLRATTAGNGYFAVLRSDNGDKLFDTKYDMPINEDGAPIMMGFEAYAPDTPTETGN